jgi:hypothetical protein
MLGGKLMGINGASIHIPKSAKFQCRVEVNQWKNEREWKLAELRGREIQISGPQNSKLLQTLHQIQLSLYYVESNFCVCPTHFTNCLY